MGPAGAPGAPGPVGTPGADAEIDMVALEAMVANMLRAAIESLEAPKCKELEHNDQICDSCNSPQQSSGSDVYQETHRSDHGQWAEQSGSQQVYASANSNSWSSQSSGSYNSQNSYNSHGSHGSHNSHSSQSWSSKSKSADGNVRIPSLKNDLNQHGSYNSHGSYNNHGNNYQQANQQQWNNHGSYQYNNNQYYAPQK